jgi:hypothetical protein
VHVDDAALAGQLAELPKALQSRADLRAATDGWVGVRWARVPQGFL